MRRSWTLLLAIVAAVAAGCGRSESDRTSAVASNAPMPAASATAVSRPKIVAFGDSLTAGLGLDPSQAYPALLQQKLDAGGYDYEVVNAGVSGDTSAGGLSRVDWVLAPEVQVLIVAFGGNDGLRGLPIEELNSNLTMIVERAKAKHADVVLAGMEAPPNLGKTYTDRFRNVYVSLAREQHVAFVPFLLAGVAGVAALNQADGIHPTAEGARIAADNVWKALEPLLHRRTDHR